MTESRILFNTVIQTGYCIGCGACATPKDSPFKMKMDEFGNVIAYPASDVDSNNSAVLAICPFSGHSLNETEIGEVFFEEAKGDDAYIGKHEACFAGYAAEGKFREKGSSGGMGKWLGYKLLEEDKIDYFVQLQSSAVEQSDALFDYAIFDNKDAVLSGSKSSYYPVSLVKVIDRIREVEGRYAITGVPCFIKTLRLLALQDEVLRNRIKFTIGIICGGMKSANQAKMIGWELGVEPDNLSAIDFRRKYTDRPATQKIYQVWSKADDKERYKNAGEIYGTDYGAGFFKPLACDYCDDVVGETADISFGDAWLPQFRNDSKGTSIIVVRNKEILSLLDRARVSKAVELFPVTAEEVARSQDGGFRHRREGLSYRLGKKEKKNEWVPKKRVMANQFPITEKRKKIYTLREEIAAKSHPAFLTALQKNDLQYFHKSMEPLVKRYYIANHGTLPVRIMNKAMARIKKILK